MDKKKPVAIDLFAGCGGLSRGLRDGGFRVVAAVELDPLAIKTYKKNHKGTIVFQKNILELPVSTVRKRLKLHIGELDLLAGCPPCQGFSRLRTLNGTRVVRDDRNDLIFEFERFARELKPKAIMIENVPGLAKGKRIKKFACSLESMGYHVEYRILDVANFGVPQRRKRTVLLAGRAAAIPWPFPEEIVNTVKTAIGSLPHPSKSKDPLHKLVAKRSKKVQELIRHIPKNGGSRSSLPAEFRLKCHKNTDGFRDIYGRMNWSLPSPTITSGCINPSKGRFLHPYQNRTITLREASILQGFPMSYVFCLDKGTYAVAEMIGNALPPEFARRHALMVKEHLKQLRV
ncbi:MAG TPA: DNA cytosine methyltransferase [Gammaproteobacteria bacterium]|nr:DNA cytosine methyltransferase [Gammaproteobacteria bacterium]